MGVLVTGYVENVQHGIAKEIHFDWTGGLTFEVLGHSLGFQNSTFFFVFTVDLRKKCIKW